MTGDKKGSIHTPPEEGKLSHDDDPVLRNLKAVYDEVAAADLPQHFLDLLNKLDEAEKRNG